MLTPGLSMFPPTDETLLTESELNTLAVLMLPGTAKPAQGHIPAPAIISSDSVEPDEDDDEVDPQFLDEPDYTPAATNTLPIPAGYTYLCQFIAHDIVADSHFHVDGRITSPLLNLDSMYGNTGNNEALNSIEYRYFDPQSGHFITQETDVYRVTPGSIENAPWATAFMPEQRNDENAIVLQLHQLFQQLHNAFIDHLANDELTTEQNILTARRYTMAVFHNMVINDLLPKLVLPACHDYFFKHHGSFFYSERYPFKTLPAEFKLATFRFGHSMLRPRYHLQTEQSQSFSLDEIMRRPPFEPLKSEHYINWPALFFDPQADEGLQQIARPIDLFITTDMATVPHPTNPKAGRNIAQLNLLAGIKVKLNSAEQIIKMLTTDPHYAQFANHFKPYLEQRRLVVNSPGRETDFMYALLAVLQEQQRTPLWLYTLHENLTDYQDNNQFKLGLIASAVNCDVLRSAMYECYRNSADESSAQLADYLSTTLQQAFNCIGTSLNTMADITTFLLTRSTSDE